MKNLTKKQIKEIRHNSLMGYKYEVCQVEYLDDKYVIITNGKESKKVLLSQVKPIIITLEWLLYVGFKKKNNILEYILPEKWFNTIFSRKYVYNSYVAKIDKNDKVKVYHSYIDTPNAEFLHEMQNLNECGFGKLKFYHINYLV